MNHHTMQSELMSRDGAEAGEGSSPDPEASPPKSAAVVIAVGAPEGESFTSEEERKVIGEKRREENGGGGAADAGAFVAVDVGEMDGGDDETVCRICHLSPDLGDRGPGLIQIGCGCKAELGLAHHHCAEIWFKLKGNRYCEICGANARNITGQVDDNFMEEGHEWRTVLSSRGSIISSSSQRRSGCWRSQTFCNFLMMCLVAAFLLPWFFKISLF